MAATIPAAAAAEIEAMADGHVLLIGMAVLAAILSCAGDRCARNVVQSGLALAAMIIAMTVPAPAVAVAMLVTMLIAAAIGPAWPASDHMVVHRQLSCLAMAVVTGGLIILNQGMICGDIVFPLLPLGDAPRPPMSPAGAVGVQLAVVMLLGYVLYSILILWRSAGVTVRAETALMTTAVLGMAA